MLNISYIIVDDQPLIHERLEELLQDYPYLKNEGHFYNAVNAQVHLLDNSPDLIFLDVDMPGISGFDLLKSINKKIKIIIVTAYRKYAVDSFDMNIIDFILKPIKPDRLNRAIIKVIDKIKSEQELYNLQFKLNYISNERNDTYIIVENSKHLNEKILYSDILYVDREINTVYFHTFNNEKYLLSNSLNRIKDMLPQNNFIRISRKKIVNISSIVSRKNNKLILITGDSFNIDPSYMDLVCELIKDNSEL